MKQILTALRLQFFFWPVMALLILILCETELLPVGFWSGEDISQGVFFLLSFVQLLTLCVIPVALKLLHWAPVKKLVRLDQPEAMRYYLRWSIVRCSLLGFVMLLNLGVYYSLLDTAGAIGSVIVLVAYAFCWPTVGKLKAETASKHVDH